MRAYDLPNYDSWLNRYNPYDNETDEELEEHLETMRKMDNIDDQKDYCDENRIEYSEIAHHI